MIVNTFYYDLSDIKGINDLIYNDELSDLIILNKHSSISLSRYRLKSI